MGSKPEHELREGSILPALFPPSSTSVLPEEKPKIATIANQWLASLSNIIASGATDVASLSKAFLENSYWRDHLCLSWDFRTFHGPSKIKSFFENHPGGIRIKSISIDPSRAVAVKPLGLGGDVNCIQIFLTVATDIGTGRGLARLFKDETDGQWKAYTLYTVLHSLNGFEEATGSRRPHGVDHGAKESRLSWKDRRDIEVEFADGSEPTVLVVGVGQGGLTIGARLKMLGVKTLIIDKNERIGDNWRKRYHQLVLHDRVYYDHLPYVPFPEHWPVYTPKDKLADWFDSYAKTMDLNVWTSGTIISTTWDKSQKRWTATIKRSTPTGDSIRILHPKHIVMATGHSGEPRMPTIPGIETFQGDRICHSSQFSGAKIPSTGKKVVVVGCCNSAHDIAQDFYEQGAEVTMVQRSSTLVISSEHGMDVMLSSEFYEGGPPIEDADLAMLGSTMPVLKRIHQDASKEIARRDKVLLEGLTKAGFKLDSGPHGAGFIVKYFERGGGYYIDVGASQLIIDGKIRVKQGQEISRILPRGIEFADGSSLEADEIILATGYDNMRSTAIRIFGKELGEKVKPVWGLDEEGEFKTMWRRSGHEGFWFMGGNLGLSRYFSRLLALQIKGLEEGLMSYNDL